MKKVILDESKCIGCGYCFSTATENFKCNDEGRASLISDKVTEEAIEASEGCPVSAITIESNCDNENNDVNEETENKCNCGDKCECGDECNCNENCECGDNCNCSDECNCGCKSKTNE